jgi:phage gp46-like protein
MASDIRYLQQADFPAYAVTLDWLQCDQNLIVDGYDLQSAVIVALGSDALAPVDQELPDPSSTDRRGWWGDMDAEEIWGGWPVGCLLWLLRRAKITGAQARQGATLALAEGWTRDAMSQFVSHQIASQIDVTTVLIGIQRIDVGVTIYRGPEAAIDLRYAALWSEMSP